jgi:DNA-binding CsgD family transcriptional regulator
VSVTTVVVLHPERLVAEAIAASLCRYPGVVPIASGPSCPDKILRRSDVAVIHADLTDAAETVTAVEALGVRPVVIGSGAEAVSSPEDLAALAVAVVPVASEGCGPAGLSSRERQVLSLAAKGLAGKQIATSLGISPKTVERHKTRIFGKLGVPNQAAAVAAVSAGMGW